MDAERVKTQMRKGILELCILSIIQRGDCYAAEIIKILKDAEMIVVEGTLYPLLSRLKNDSLLTYRWEESTGGPPRKYYELTAEGEAFLEELKNNWYSLKNTVNKITKENG